MVHVRDNGMGASANQFTLAPSLLKAKPENFTMLYLTIIQDGQNIWPFQDKRILDGPHLQHFCKYSLRAYYWSDKKIRKI